MALWNTYSLSIELNQRVELIITPDVFHEYVRLGYNKMDRFDAKGGNLVI